MSQLSCKSTVRRQYMSAAIIRNCVVLRWYVHQRKALKGRHTDGTSGGAYGFSPTRNVHHSLSHKDLSTHGIPPERSWFYDAHVDFQYNAGPYQFLKV